MSMMPGRSRGAQLALERVDAEAQVEVEHVRAVLDQQVVGRHRRGRPRRARSRRLRAMTGLVAARRRRGAGGQAPDERLDRRRPARAPCAAACSSETARKRTVSPGLSWPIFHSSACDDGRGADEAAEAGAIGAEDDRHVAGEIDRADGVGVVVNVGRMQAGLAAVLARPLRLRADEAHAGAVGVVVHLPGGGEERLDVVGGEEIGRAVRAVEHADLPLVGVARDERERQRGAGACGARPQVQHIARAQRAAGMAAELARG